MVLLDAQALIALVAGEPAGQKVAGLLRREEVGIATINLAEAVDILTRRLEVPIERCREVMEPLLAASLAVIPLQAHHAWRVGEVRAAHYQRTSSPLSLADCVLIASANEDDAVATSDPDLLAAARAEGLAIIPLPDSRGEPPDAK